VQSLNGSIKLSDPENRLVCALQASGGISCTSYVIADFVLKIANCRIHGNKGLPERNVTGKVELDDPENHTIDLYRTRNYDSILCTTDDMANFLLKFPIFRYHSNRGRLSKVCLTPLNFPIPKTP